MARCDTCGTSILFGGVRDDGFRFCNVQCQERGGLLKAAKRLPEELVSHQVQLVHRGDCPKCGGPGPVDVHTSYTVWSAVVLTSWRERPQVCCRPCGNKSRVVGAFTSMLFGWWGIPFGLVITPVQIFRNVAGLVSPPDPETPSAQLENEVRKHLATHLAKATPLADEI